MEELNFIYAEYVRINALIDSYAASSFSDFQLLGVVGVMLAWEPFANRVTNQQDKSKENTKIIFLGFVAIFFVVAIIATRDLMKQSIIAFQIIQLDHYEQAIRNLANFELSDTFKGSSEWRTWLKDVHVPVSYHFRFLLITLTIIFPAAVLWSKDRKYTFAYIGIALLLVIVYVRAVSYLTAGINA